MSVQLRAHARCGHLVGSRVSSLFFVERGSMVTQPQQARKPTMPRMKLLRLLGSSKKFLKPFLSFLGRTARWTGAREGLLVCWVGSREGCAVVCVGKWVGSPVTGVG